MNIKRPTLRKLRRRGLVAIRYQERTGFRHGWIVSIENGCTIVRLIGDNRNRRIRGRDRNYITRLEG